jgi:hypothetical protein
MLSHRHDTTGEQSTSSETETHALCEEDLIVLGRKTQDTYEKGTSDRANDSDPFRAIRIDDSTEYCAA